MIFHIFLGFFARVGCLFWEKISFYFLYISGFSASCSRELYSFSEFSTKEKYIQEYTQEEEIYDIISRCCTHRIICSICRRDYLHLRGTCCLSWSLYCFLLDYCYLLVSYYFYRYCLLPDSTTLTSIVCCECKSMFSRLECPRSRVGRPGRIHVTIVPDLIL